MDPDYLPFHASPRKPGYMPPSGSVDAHCHVFGPATHFPYHPKRKYTPCDASKEQLFALRDYLGIERNVIVQASCHGTDNAALLDALQGAAGLARGVAVVGPDITDDELLVMHQAGVRAVRFNFVKRLVDSTPREVFSSIARKIRRYGWHIVVYFEAADLEDLIPFLIKLDHRIVIDHMGRPDVTKGVDHAGFQRFLRLLDENPGFYTKVSCPERLTRQAPDYSDVAPYAQALVERFPEQVLWGTDWPHPNMKSHMPDDGQLVDLIPNIAPTRTLQQAMLVDNPMRLYWT